MYYYYHADQDDRICENCAKEVKHTDTAYAGQNVFSSNVVEEFGGMF